MGQSWVAVLGFPPAAMLGSTAWGIAPESPTCAYSCAKFRYSHFLRRSCLRSPLSGDALHLPSPTSAGSQGSGRRSFAPTALLAPASPAQHPSEKPEERNTHKHAEVIWPLQVTAIFELNNKRIKTPWDSRRLCCEGARTGRLLLGRIRKEQSFACSRKKKK